MKSKLSLSNASHFTRRTKSMNSSSKINWKFMRKKSTRTPKSCMITLSLSKVTEVEVEVHLTLSVQTTSLLTSFRWIHFNNQHLIRHLLFLKVAGNLQVNRNIQDHKEVICIHQTVKYSLNLLEIIHTLTCNQMIHLIILHLTLKDAPHHIESIQMKISQSLTPMESTMRRMIHQSKSMDLFL